MANAYADRLNPYHEVTNPYAKWKGRQGVSSMDPHWDQFFTEQPGMYAGEIRKGIAPQFAPYATSQMDPLWDGGWAWQDYIDFDRLNADTEAKLAADAARWASMGGWDDIKYIGGSPNYAKWSELLGSENLIL